VKLDELRIPNEDVAGERAWQVVRTAYEAREPVIWPRRHARPLLAAAVVAAVVAAALSPPGRSVIRSLRKAVGVQNAQPELFSLPAPGQLLVTSRGGTWIVHSDGSRRRVGAYRAATWSPHGLFVAATRKNELLALDPEGHVRWSLARRSARLPSWGGTRTDTRIAYLSGGRLRVVAGDGTGDQAIGLAAPVAPAWRPGPERVLAYAAPRGGAVVRNLDTGSVLLRTPPATVSKLSWSGDGRLLLVFAPYGSRVYDRRGRVVQDESPSDATHDTDATFVPGAHRVTFIRAHGLQSDVFSGRDGQLLFRGTGVFGQLAFSPNGRWVLVTWPTANQWVFVRNGRRKIVGAAQIARQFGGFPRIEGWCCGS
jgi:hypothetical protein